MIAGSVTCWSHVRLPGGAMSEQPYGAGAGDTKPGETGAAAGVTTGVAGLGLAGGGPTSGAVTGEVV